MRIQSIRSNYQFQNGKQTNFKAARIVVGHEAEFEGIGRKLASSISGGLNLLFYSLGKRHVGGEGLETTIISTGAETNQISDVFDSLIEQGIMHGEDFTRGMKKALASIIDFSQQPQRAEDMLAEMEQGPYDYKNLCVKG